jgi:hypothetical protein
VAHKIQRAFDSTKLRGKFDTSKLLTSWAIRHILEPNFVHILEMDLDDHWINSIIAAAHRIRSVPLQQNWGKRSIFQTKASTFQWVEKWVSEMTPANEIPSKEIKGNSDSDSDSVTDNSWTFVSIIRHHSRNLSELKEKTLCEVANFEWSKSFNFWPYFSILCILISIVISICFEIFLCWFLSHNSNLPHDICLIRLIKIGLTVILAVMGFSQSFWYWRRQWKNGFEREKRKRGSKISWWKDTEGQNERFLTGKVAICFVLWLVKIRRQKEKEQESSSKVKGERDKIGFVRDWTKQSITKLRDLKDYFLLSWFVSSLPSNRNDSWWNFWLSETSIPPPTMKVWMNRTNWQNFGMNCIFATFVSSKSRSLQSMIFASRNDQDLIASRLFELTCLSGRIDHRCKLVFGGDEYYIPSPIFWLNWDDTSHNRLSVRSHHVKSDHIVYSRFRFKTLEIAWIVCGEGRFVAITFWDVCIRSKEFYHLIF